MKIIYTDSEQNLHIITPAPSWNGTLEQLAQKDVPHGLEYRIVNDDFIPNDREFRNAWKLEGQSIAVDMPKAKEIWREKIRKARKPILDSLDIEYQKADEINDRNAKNDIAQKKTVLRNMPQDPRIENAKTPEELKQIWFSELNAQ